MKYALNPNYTFCGWDGLPFAIMDTRNKDVSFLEKGRFDLLWSCDSYTDIDVDSLTEGEQNFLRAVQEEGIVQEAAPDARLQLHRYKRHPCAYYKEVQLSITGKCNYRCLHCFQSAPHGVLGQPSTEEVFEVLDQMAECGIYRVSLTGGEPLIHEGFWDIVDRIKQNNMLLTTVYSNGALVNQELLDGFKARGMKPSWSISFDGLGYHDHMRGVEGAEVAAINAIRLLVDSGFSVGCAYSLTKGNVKVFRETANFLAELGVSSIKSGDTNPQGEWLNNPEEWLSDQDYLDFYCEYIPQYLADGRPLSLQFEGLFYGTGSKQEKDREQTKTKALSEGEGQQSEGEDQPDEKPYGFMCERNISEEKLGEILSCGSMQANFYIGPTGRVLPCMGIDGVPAGEAFPTLYEVPLREILSKGSHFMWATRVTMKDVFDHNKEECEDCDQRAHCGSGCRASALVSNDQDYMSCDLRTCMICKEDWAGKVKAAIAAAGLE